MIRECVTETKQRYEKLQNENLKETDRFYGKHREAKSPYWR